MDEDDLRNLGEMLRRRRSTPGILRWFVVLRRPATKSSSAVTQQIPIRRRKAAAPASSAWA